MKPKTFKSHEKLTPSGRLLASVILAAGYSSRMGHAKALLQVSPTEASWQRILTQHLNCGLKPLLVVSSKLSIYLKPFVSDTVLLVNPQPEKGTLSSLKLALNKFKSASGVLIHPVDHPLVSDSTLLRLRSLHQSHPQRILIPTSKGEKGHPVVFGVPFIPKLLAAPLDEGARFVVRSSPSAVHLVEVEDKDILANLNSPEDLLHWRNKGYWIQKGKP